MDLTDSGAFLTILKNTVWQEREDISKWATLSVLSINTGKLSPVSLRISAHISSPAAVRSDKDNAA